MFKPEDLPPKAVEVIEGWLDPDVRLIEEQTTAISEAICRLNLLADDVPKDRRPDIHRCTILLSHLYFDLKTFVE